MASIAPDLLRDHAAEWRLLRQSSVGSPIDDEAAVALGWVTRLVRVTGMGEARGQAATHAVTEMEVAPMSRGVFTDRPRQVMVA